MRYIKLAVLLLLPWTAQAQISIVASGTSAYTTNADGTADLGGTSVSGDLAVAWGAVSSDASGRTIADPSGYTQSRTPSTTGTLVQYLWHKAAGAGEADPTIDASGMDAGDHVLGTGAILRGVNTTTPVHASAVASTTTGSNTSITTPALTITEDNTLVVLYVSCSTDATSFGGYNPNGTGAWTVLNAFARAGSASHIASRSYYSLQTTATNITAGTISVSGAGFAATCRAHIIAYSADPSAPPAFSGTIANQSDVEDSAIATLTLTSYWNTGGALTSCSVSAGTLPTGLTLNSCAGGAVTITGTPTTAGVSSGLVITGTNADGSAASNSFSWTISAVGGAFSVNPTVTSQTDVAYTLSGTTSASTAVSAVACIKDSTAPTIAQVVAGDCTGDVDAQAASSDTWNGADTLTLGGSLTLPIYDVYATDGTSLVTLADEALDAPTGRQHITLTSIGSGTPIETLNGLVTPDLIAGDILRCDSTTTPGAYAVTVSAAGHFSYIGSAARQYVDCDVYDVSAGGMHASDLDLWVNNSAPVCGAPTYRLILGETTTHPLVQEEGAACIDTDSSLVTVANTSGTLPTGCTLSGSSVSCTPSVVAATTAVVYTATDDAGATTTINTLWEVTAAVSFFDLTISSTVDGFLISTIPTVDATHICAVAVRTNAATPTGAQIIAGTDWDGVQAEAHDCEESISAGDESVLLLDGLDLPRYNNHIVVYDGSTYTVETFEGVLKTPPAGVEYIEAAP